MKVIIIHSAAADTVAIVEDNAVLEGLDYSDVDPEDSKGLLGKHPMCKLDLNKILNSILCNFGVHVQTDITIDVSETTAGALNG